MNPIVENIMDVADTYAEQYSDFAYGRRPEQQALDARQALRAAIEQALGQGEPVAEIYRRQLEAIAVGDSTDPVKDAGELLVETGFWHSTPGSTPQPQHKQDTLNCLWARNGHDVCPTTTPKPQREWVGLEYTEIVEAALKAGIPVGPAQMAYHIIEAKLREKNGGGV